MQVSDILARKGREVVTVRPGVFVEAAVGILARHNIGAVVISRDGRRIDGILTERDLVRGVARHGKAYLEKRAEDITVHKVYTCVPDDDIETVIAEMRRRHIRHMPVAVHGMLTGMISIVDILRAHMSRQVYD